MDYETILKAPETLYIGLAAGGLAVGSVAGYISGRLNSAARTRNAQFNRDIELAKQETERARYELQKQQVLTGVELRRLEIADADNEHRRGLEKSSEERKYQAESKDRERARTLENEDTRHKRELEVSKEQHDYRLKLAEKLGSLKPEITAYLDAVKEIAETGNTDLEYEKQRKKYREELVEEWLERLDKDDPFKENIEYIDETHEIIDRLVDLRFPLRNTPQLSGELEKLLKMIVE